MSLAPAVLASPAARLKTLFRDGRFRPSDAWSGGSEGDRSVLLYDSCYTLVAKTSDMNRRSLLVALGTTAAIAGCLDGRTDSPANENGTGTMGPGDEGQLRNRFDGEPVRPECEQTSETITVERGDETWERDTVATIPYPDPPRSFGTDEIAAYVKSFEAAHVRHDAVCGSSDAILASRTTSESARHSTGTAPRLQDTCTTPAGRPPGLTRTVTAGPPTWGSVVSCTASTTPAPSGPA